MPGECVFALKKSINSVLSALIIYFRKCHFKFNLGLVGSQSRMIIIKSNFTSFRKKICISLVF